MKGTSASTALLVLLLPAVFGCQLKAMGAQDEIVVSTQQSGQKEGPVRPVLKTQDDRIAYSLGVDVGNELQNLELKAGSFSALEQGIRDSVLGNVPLLTLEEMEQARRIFLAERVAGRVKQLGPVAEKNVAEGEQFLAQNAKKAGVKVLPSGLQYRVIGDGSGATPDITDAVRIKYVVKSLDGKELQSSYKTGKPVVIPVRGGIPAWSEALQLMREGDKWELFAPGHLGYGDKTVGDTIGPFQAVIFELELVGIE